MNTKELLELHDFLCKQAKSIIEAKNHDYTAGSVDPFANFRAAQILGVEPEIGLLIRCLDKIKRIETFVKKHDLKVQGEKVQDAILDVINYMILLVGLIEERK